MHGSNYRVTIEPMSEQKKSNKPFETLGKQLRSIRTKRKESLIEVSGAVEIDSDELLNFEDGAARPSEEILALLISYFDIKDEESTKLWELAGYNNNSADNLFSANEDQVFQQQPQLIVMPIDARIVYTDQVHVMINNYGVVINFMQGAGPHSQPLAVSRIGMSKEHAKSLLEVLKTTIEQAEKPKEIRQLPGTTNSNKSNK